MPATISSCLNSWGLCGRAYQLPGLRRAGTRKSRAPSGVERVSVGVSISTKSWPSSTSRAALLTLLRRRSAALGAAAAQVEVAVLEPDLLPHVDVVVDRERQRRGRVQHLDLVGDDLDLAGGQVGVRVALGTGADLAGDLDAVLAAQAVRHGLVADDDLDQAAGLAQVEEGHAPVIAASGHPPGEGDGLADVLGAQGAGVMGADHWCCSSWLRVDRGRGGRARCLRWSSVLAGRACRDHGGPEVLGGRGPGGRVGRGLLPRADVLHLVAALGVGEPDVGDAAALGVPDLLAELLGARGHLAGDAVGAQGRGDRVAGGAGLLVDEGHEHGAGHRAAGRRGRRG